MTVFGWDMSHYDAPGVGPAVAEGIAFLTHKAGGDADDAELGAWWGGVRGLDPARVLLGAYWVLYPGDPAGRADRFLARLDATCPGWRDRPFLLQADCEKWNGDPGTVPGRADIRAFCDRLTERMPRLRPIVYAPKWVYGDALTGLGYPLWASSYVNGAGAFRALYPGDGSSRWAAYSGQTPAILQYSSSATIGGQTTSDANAYRGTLAELIRLAAPGWEDTMDWTDDVITNPAWRADSKTNPTVRANFAIYDVWNQAHSAAAAAAAARADVAALKNQLAALNTGLGAAIAAIAAKDVVDEAALAEHLSQGVAAVVLAGLPADRDDITPAELQEAILEVLRKLVN
ncbi:hypothetical protein [Actinoplanes sp. NPDC026623]|uniref:hypothetical protein n=1 Tax=Actinoplanes sp. NPDC026623 TaxID=3155610 RepID=UPI0033D592A6